MNEGNMLMEDIIIMLGIAFNLNLPLLTAWLLDHWLGDPVCCRILWWLSVRPFLSVSIA